MSIYLVVSTPEAAEGRVQIVPDVPASYEAVAQGKRHRFGRAGLLTNRELVYLSWMSQSLVRYSRFCGDSWGLKPVTLPDHNFGHKRGRNRFYVVTLVGRRSWL
jgi:hypothetical protein